MYYDQNNPYYGYNAAGYNSLGHYDPYAQYAYAEAEYERQVNLSQMGQQLVNSLLQENFGVASGQVNNIMNIFLTRRRDVLRLIEAYGVPPRISQALTRRIVIFVINNAPNLPVLFPQQVNRLVNQFFREDRLVIPILRFFGVPDFVIRQYITRVIRVTLRNLVFIPGPSIEATVNQLLAIFEQRFPNFLGLTSVYNIPVFTARNIVRGIIRFTLLNVERISAFGSINARAQEMVNLIFAEQPELIRVMIRNGVPANRADDIARQIVAFTLREGGLYEE